MNKHRAGLLLATLALAGCANLFPPHQPPAVELPAAWPGLSEQAARYDEPEWWKIYGDPALDRLIEEALASNHDIAVATARIHEARAQVTLADVEREPTLTGTFTPSITRNSQRGPNPMPPGTRVTSRNNVLRLNAAYEIDLWGKLRGASAAARADLLATEYARNTVRNALAADIAQGYFALLALDAQIATARRTLQTREEVLKLQQLRMQSGVSSEFEVRQVEAEVAGVKSLLPQLERDRGQQQNALAVLLGRSPRVLVEGQVALGAPLTPAAMVVPSGLPSELLLRRPDLQQAEQRLIAANARIGVARAAYYPSISLTGFLGGESRSLSDLFSGPARIFSFAVDLMQPIFGAKRIGASVDVARAQEEQAVAQYRQAIANAFRDVQDALIAQQSARSIVEAEHARVGALKSALALARLRYDNGISSQLEVLDAERNLLQAELDRTEADRSHRAAIVDLFQAMGGGWKLDGEVEAKK